MDVSGFFNTFLGNYITQVFVHSLITALIVDGSITAWKVENPESRLHMRLMVIILPVLLHPLYQMMNPDRGSVWFRLDALFDTHRWLYMDLWEGFGGWAVFLLFVLFTSFVFLFQELIPVLRHSFVSREAAIVGEPPQEGSPVFLALNGLPKDKADVLVVDDNDLVLFSSTGSRPAIIVSTGLAEFLTTDELRAAIAHEMGHISASKRPMLVALFLLRVFQFYNPVALMEFRRIVQEEEKICDDYAVSVTNDPGALKDALLKFIGPPDDAADMGLKERLVEYSHRALIESRIWRLENWSGNAERGNRAAFVFAAVAALVINYFVV